MLHTDPELLSGLVEEIRGYLSGIRAGVANPTDPEVLYEAYRCAHSIGGAAGMCGLDPLSQLGQKMELAIDRVVAGEPSPPAFAEKVFHSVDAIERYMDRCEAGEIDASEDIDAALLMWADAPPPPSDTFDLPDFLSGFDSSSLPDFHLPAPSTPASGEEGWGEGGQRSQSQDACNHSPDPTDEEAIPAELLEVFAMEAEEHLRTITTNLPAIREQPENRELLREVRRSAHTLKGSAAMVGFKSLTQLAHRMEDLLDLLYDGEKAVTPDIVQLLFDTADALEDQAAGRTPIVQGLYDRFAAFLVESEAQAKDELPSLALQALTTPQETAGVREAGQFLRVPLERLDALVKLVGELVISRSEFEQRLGGLSRQVEELQLSTARLSRSAGKLEVQYEARGQGTNRLLGRPGMPTTSADRPYGFDDLEFDRYTEFHLLTREVAETASDIRTIGNEIAGLNRDFEGYLTRQTRLSGELQDKLMRARMVPLSMLGSRLERTVRTAAASSGKQVELVVDGDRTELDKTVLEEMSEPLLHLLRNAVDHGIEPPAERGLRGKAPAGAVRVRAFTEGTQVVIRVSDDGGGIDPERVRAVAVEKGFVPAASASSLNQEELFQLLFQPGFSTARQVSELSGRGVGLDVVRAQVHRLKGALTLNSDPGRGTTFTIRLPLTLAILRALLVRSGGQTFAVPLGAVTQILRLEDGQAAMLGREAVVRVNGEVYPRCHLSRALNLRSADETVARPPVVIVNAGEKQVALVVDRIIGAQEIVVKSLGTHIRRVPGIAGATLMGDGSVVLILNPGDLVSGGSTQAKSVRTETPRRRAEVKASGRRVMVVDDSPSVRRIATTLLKNAGWDPVVAKDGVEALEILHQGERPSAVLLDVEMPRMDGYEFLSTLRADDVYRDVPVVMITSRAGDKHRRKAMDLGATAYLVKPYQDAVLLNMLRELTGATV